jgi:hypothetical protein
MIELAKRLLSQMFSGVKRKSRRATVVPRSKSEEPEKPLPQPTMATELPSINLTQNRSELLQQTLS